MSFVAVLLTPLALMFPAGGIELPGAHAAPLAALGENPPEPQPPAGGWIFREVAENFRVEAQNQVRIEQHMTIRITPARPMQMPRNFLLDLPQREIGPRFAERAMGRCLSVAGIVGVQPDARNRLILFLRDRRMVSATLERACSARDFYSGFYVDRTDDGQLCAGRDMLLSRSGANCKLTQFRQLVDMAD